MQLSRVRLAAIVALGLVSTVPTHLSAAEGPPPAAAAPVAEAAPPAQPQAAKTAPPAPAKPETTLLIDIDLTRQQMTVSESGKVTGSWPISSGAEGHRSPTGTFRPLWSAKMWYSKKYDNAPMPHAVFFNGGVAMHATQATGMLGRPASHGCIRQSPANAATTYRLVAKHGNAHTKIVVHGSPREDVRMARKARPAGEQARLAARDGRDRPSRAEAAMRRVVLVDVNGNRRVAEVPVDDPRLIAYQRRTSRMADARRPYFAENRGYYSW